MKNLGVILAAGKGTRLNSADRNKTTLDFNGKPIIQYGLESLEKVVDSLIVVVGAFSDSVKASVGERKVTFVEQTPQEGTGHAAKVVVNHLKAKRENPEVVLLGYGDHMMFFTPELFTQFLNFHKKEGAVMTLLSTQHENPDELAWGRIVRDVDGNVSYSVEQKDADEHERKITELNVGFYAFDWEFLKNNVDKLQKSPVSGEYYINALVEIARSQNMKVSAFKTAFENVGIGINTREQLAQSQELFKNKLNSSR